MEEVEGPVLTSDVISTEKIKNFVLDTNVVLYDKKSVYSFKNNNVIIPIQVIEELDKFKKGNDTINANAREFIRIIEAMPREKVYDGGAPLGEGLGKIRVIIGYPYHKKVKRIYPEETMDNLILNTAYYLSSTRNIFQKIISWLSFGYFYSPIKDNENKGEIILVTKDVNLRMKAGALNLKAEDFKNDSVPNSNSYYQEVRSFEISDENASDLYSKGTTIMPDISDLYENEFVILNPKKPQLCLTKFESGKLHLITPRFVSPFGIKARNNEQDFAFNALMDPKISLVTIAGVAGTGKTLLALAVGLQLLKEGVYDHIYFTRQIIGLSNGDIGFLPGDANDKVSPYMKGFEDNLDVIKRVSVKNSNFIIESRKSEKITVEPLVYLRGRSISRTYFIIDETQNNTPQDVKSITTRAGEGSKFVFSGDVTQIDSPFLDQSSNGLTNLISRMKGQNVYAHINLLKCERSYLAELTAKLLQ